MHELVSIVTPTYNRSHFLKDVIDSLSQQTYPHWELLIVDDGSTDNTRDILHECTDKRVRYLQRNRAPKGANTCRNIGMDEAKGEFLIFLDSDDYLASFALSKRLTYLKEHPELDFAVFPGLCFIQNPGDDRRIAGNITEVGQELEAFLNRHNPWQTSGPLWRVSSLRIAKIRWHEGLKIFQDVDFHIRALAAQLNYANLQDEQPDFFWRNHTGDKITNHSTYVMHHAACVLFIDDVARELARKQLLNERKRGLLANYLFYIARIITQEKEWGIAIEVWYFALEESYVTKNKFYKGCFLLSLFRIFYFKWMRESLVVKRVLKQIYRRLNFDKTSVQPLYQGKVKL